MFLCFILIPLNLLNFCRTMTERPTEFAYHNIELCKSESLGSGSYGGVCKAKCDGLLCAAKIMHPTLFDLHDPGASSYLRKFREECHLLSLARHPNVVQYLHTFTDPDTRLPVLLMELCNESLTAFLEQSPGQLSYHVEVKLCNDIALALVYLHSNGLIHRDLTGNNVLIIAGPRAKITDFGMSKLAIFNPAMTGLTMCPGNVLYMSPEALDEAKSYTDKLDVFSFGVIIIQIITRKFPSPTDRFRSIPDPRRKKDVREVVPETERRKSHLQLIADTHALKPLIFQCLRKEDERPSAFDLNQTISKLMKPSAKFMVSEACGLCKKYEAQIRELEGIGSETREQLHKSERLVSELLRRLQQKERTISSLQPAYERQITQPKLHDTRCMSVIQQVPVTQHDKEVQKPTKMLKRREGKNAPEAMSLGAAVVHGNTAYFRPENSHKVYSYKVAEEEWFQLPNNPMECCGLTIIDGTLTSVGGMNPNPTNTLLSLCEEGGKKQWCDIFPPMPTARRSAACVTTQHILVVAGGYRAGRCLDNVEIMNTNSKQWTTASSLPHKRLSLSATLCGDELYLAGGFKEYFLPSKIVFRCSLPDLLPPTTFASRIQRIFPRNTWKKIGNLPVTRTTLASFGEDLLAIGGNDDSDIPTSNIYRYDSVTDSWIVTSWMKNKRSACLAATLSEAHLVVVGGYTGKTVNSKCNTVELLE